MKAALLRAAGALLVVGALGLMFARAPDLPVEALIGRWAPPPSEFMHIGEQLVHFRDEGPRYDPVPIVLIHGTGSSLHTWEGWSHALREQRRVVSFDLPGFGLTGPRPSGDYREETDARFVLALMDALGVRRAAVAGSSLGGKVARQIASLAPERVDRLILVSPTDSVLQARVVPVAGALAKVPLLNRMLDTLLPRSTVEAALRFVYGDPSRVTPELIERHFSLALRQGNRRALIERLSQTPHGETDDIERKLTLPTLILWGGRDRVIPPAHAQRVADDIAGSRSVVFETLGHLPQEEDPAGTVAAAKTFLGIVSR
jgi:pimeloyl-ACP methyl ester carboxylesterase